MASQQNITTDEFRLLRDYIEQHCGIALGDEKAYLIETRLSRLMIDKGCNTFAEFYRLIKNDAGSELRDKIVDAMTTNETLWFRDSHPFTILREVLLPLWAQRFREGKQSRVRIWSAACSTGQEPYSTGMVITEFCQTQNAMKPEHFDILATDISASAIFIAMAGRYDGISMGRGLADNYRDRFFKQDGRLWLLDDKIKKMVSFKRYNLQESPAQFGHFDLVYLRNVAIYFSEELKRRIFANLAKVLSPDGHLIIGAVESLRGYSDAFDLLIHKGGHYYRVR